jgi:hypothetical protein
MMDWKLDPTDFANIVADAVRAPSMHNSQPWRFRLTGPTIDLHLDPRRQLSVGDPTGRAARVACGAALFNMRLALAVRGTLAIVEVLPVPQHDTLVARLIPGAPRPATPHDRRLHAAIPRRHSNRHPFTETPVPAAARADLVRAAGGESAWLHLAESVAEFETTVDLIREADGRCARTPNTLPYPPHAVLRFGYGLVPYRAGRRPPVDAITPQY